MKKILIIEDDLALRENTAELLELEDFKVLTAANGRTGIARALKHKPDIIICDIMMPEVDGYGVLEELASKEATKFIPFIFVSAKTEYKEIRKGMDLGADDYLTKPFEEEELLKAVKSRLLKAREYADHRKDEKKDEDDTDENPKNLNQLKNFFTDEGEEKQFRKGETIYQKGDHSDYIYLITYGAVKTNTMNSYGKELITGLYQPDDFLGFTSFDDNIPHSETAIAVENTEVVRLSKRVLTKILKKSQDVSVDLMNLLSQNLTQTKKELMRMAYSSVRRKTAATILQFAKLMNKKPNDPIRIPRSDLAANAGIATESLIRTLSHFKKKNLIAIEGRTIRVIDYEGLKAVN